MTLQAFFKTLSKLEMYLEDVQFIYVDSKTGTPYYQFFNDPDDYDTIFNEYIIEKHPDKIKYLYSSLAGDELVITLDADSVMKVLKNSPYNAYYNFGVKG